MDWLAEYFGGSETLALPGNVGTLKPPCRIPGSVRYYKASPTAGSDVILPRGDLVPNGESVAIYNASGTYTLTLKNQAGTTIGTIAQGVVAQVYQTAQSTNGSWVFTQYTAAESSSLTFGRVPLDCTIGADTLDFNLRDYHDALGYGGTTPAALRVFVGNSSRNYLMGNSGSDPAVDCGFDSGEWPSGTTLLLFNWGTISGKGGDGGRGGDVPPGLLAQAGGDGTHGMRLRVPTVIVNHGRIQGGGGGGGGSAWNGSTSAGSGGGGGQGHVGGTGGQPGTGAGGVAGVDGSAFVAGGGGIGISSAGNGGAAGSSGSSGYLGALGGSPGSAILRLTSVSVTKIVAGTILGAEGTF